MSVSSRERFRRFLQDYRQQRLDQSGDEAADSMIPHKDASAQWRRHPGLSPEYVSRSAGHRPAGSVSVRWIGSGQHRVRPPRCHGRRDRTRRPARQCTRVHRQLPERCETFIGERGVKLSGGQCQRLAIARAILAQPRILILDEATSNLDTESEQLIQESMTALLAEQTTFVIAHRLSTIRQADLIMLMEDGRVIERGTHQELMGARGTYHQMVLRQLEHAGQNGGDRWD